MSFQRIIITSAGMRQYKRTSPPLNPHPLQEILNQVPPSSHVTAEFALAVAMDLLGMELAFKFVRASAMTLMTWVHVIEMHGWGHGLREYDLQVNLLINAIKTFVTAREPHPVKRQTMTDEVIKEVCQGNKDLENALVTSLLLNKGLDLPWALVAPLPANCTDTYGVYANAPVTQ